MTNYDLLLRKLDEFIRKYYKNMLLRGGIYFVAIFLIFYLLVNVIEYFGRFDTLTRTFIFYIYLSVNVIVLWRLVIVPVFKLLHFGRIISHEQAAEIIGDHFPDVQDKLLNTLQLKQLEGSAGEAGNALILAGIDQKISTLKPVPFKKAIDLKKNKKYLRYVVPPVVIFLILLVITPQVVTEPAGRLIHHYDHFEIPLPFDIFILNDELKAIQQDDFTLEIMVEGEEVPSEVFIEIDGLSYKCSRDNPVRFHYSFINIRNDQHFFLVAGRYRSPEYELTVLPRPIILSFETVMDYPSYTGKKDEVLENTGDLVIPAGTSVTWRFHTRDTRKISFTLGQDKPTLIRNETSNTFEYAQKILESNIYSVVTANQFMRNKDSLVYSISVISDLYPIIIVEEFQDSLVDKRLYFKGLIKDDYGFNRLTFSYIHKPYIDSEEPAGKLVTTRLPVSRSATQQQYFHYFNLDSVGVQPGDEVSYYFEVWDNDAVNGSKKTRSQMMVFKAPTLEEITEQTSESNEEIKSEMEKAIDELQELQKDIEELNRKLIEKENIGWQEQQQIKELLNRQQEIEKQLENIRQENRMKSRRENQYKEIDEELLRKQKMLEELFEKIMTDEMKKMFEELQKLLEELDKDKINEMLEQMKMSNEDLEKQLDRNLELFKQLEFEKMLQDAIDKLDELAEKQKKLAEETVDKQKDKEQLTEEQKKLNEEFEKLRKELDDLHKKNSELEDPNNIEQTDSEEEDIQEEMDQSLDELEEGKSSKASKSQKSASGKMMSLSGKLKKMQSDMYAENLGEDIDALREILENLIQLSFDQEDLINNLQETSLLDPKYVGIIHDQSRIKEDLVMVEDSLYALSKRQASIQPFVNREIDAINRNVDKALFNLNERKKGPAAGNQQFVMTSINNLALLLSEALRQMMSNLQMQSSGQCSKGCPKPGGGGKSMKGMKQLQQQLNAQIEALKKGKKTGKGQKSQKGKSSMSEQLARMAAEQAAIRRLLEGYQDELKKQGLGNSPELNDLMRQMDKTETELVNKIITQQTLERQKEILSRLLKHEKAELKREREEKRESREAKNEIISNPNEFLEYKRLKTQEVELLKTIPPNLRPFYIKKINEYFYRLN